MARDPVVNWRRTFRTVLDPRAVGPQSTLDVPAQTRLPELRRRLRALYGEHPQVDRVLVRVDGLDIGIATRATADKDPGHLGAAPAAGLDPGSGDGATLPGFPGEFRPVRYECRETGCRQRMVHMFYDERRVPRCVDHPTAEVVYQP